MIELQIKGPRKKEIEQFLRNKSKDEKDNLQMFRIKYGSLKEYEMKKFTQISLPKLTGQKRKNDMSKLISLSVLSKIQQNKSLTEEDAKHLVKLSPQRKTKLLIKTQSKQGVEDVEMFHHSQNIITVVRKHDDSIKQKMIKIVGLDNKRKFSLSRRKSMKQLIKIKRSVTVNSFEVSQESVCRDSLSQKYHKKMKALQKEVCQKSKKQECQKMKNLINKRLSPSICVIKKFKTKPEEACKYQDMKKTEFLKTIKDREESRQLRQKNNRVKAKTIGDVENVKATINAFQNSLGPWGNSSVGFFISD